MKNITLSAEEDIIDKARKKALLENSSLNERFRAWLKSYASPQKDEEKYQWLMQKLSYVQSGKKFTRDELNER